MKEAWGVSGAALCSLTELEAHLLQQRAVKLADRELFYNPVYEQAIHSPGQLFGIGAAIERLTAAGKRRERVLVYGDYDADGLTGAAILTVVLRQLGAEVVPFIPHRFDHGYSLNQSVLEQLSSAFDVLLTVDCGVSSVAEVAWVKRQRKDVIIVDHHEWPVGEGPVALAVLHPRHPKGDYPFPYLSGAGVAWKLAAALLNDRPAEQALLDLTVLGTVADMVPLLGENRSITKFGLEQLRRTQRPGLRCLLQNAGLENGELTAELLSWRLIPQLNAAGKMDHAQPVLDLLLADNLTAASKPLHALLEYNRERRRVTTRVLDEAEALLDEGSEACLFVTNTRWPAGVVGLVAGRLAQKYGRPAVVIGGNGRHGVGSARGPEGVSVLELLRAGEAHLLKLGGHARAAGFSVEEKNIHAFREALASASMMKPAPSPTNKGASTMIAAHLLDWRLLQLMERFEPFGHGNERPRLVAQAVPLVSVRLVGSSGQHIKCLFEVHGQLVEGIGFGLAEAVPRGAKTLDILFQVEVDEWRGRRSWQLKLQDVA